MKTKEMKRREQINYIMEHWDELPKELQGVFEGTISTIRHFVTAMDDPEGGGGDGSGPGKKIA